MFASINDELIYRRIFTGSAENSFQSFGHGKCAKTLHISKAYVPIKLQGVNTHPENSARHSEQTSKLSQAFSMLTDMKALLHIANLAFVRVLKTIKNNQNTKGFNPWKAL